MPVPFFQSNDAPKLIAIMGATGQQGGAAIRAFHALKESGNATFRLRAITRDPTSEKAQAITPMVDEIVKADANDIASMVEAFRGCHGAFLLSNFWEDFDVGHEMIILRNLKEAVKRANVKHIVNSTLEDTRDFVENANDKDTWKIIPVNGGSDMLVPHFDGKGEVRKEFEEEGLPVTSFYTSFYYENFVNLGMGPTRQSESDPYAITFPISDARIPVVAVDDIGKAICAIFQDSSLIGKSVGIMSETLSGAEMAETFSKICGQSVVYNAVPWNVYASFGFPGAEDLANMFRFKVDFNEMYTETRTISDEFDERMGGRISFEHWVVANKGAFVLDSNESIAKKTMGEAEEKSEKEVKYDEEDAPEICCSQCNIM
jgi:uncharacterized protein YbjT (DUF2867 family)